MRAVWTGTIGFGSYAVPVKAYSATEDRELPLHQVHEADGGRVRVKRVCEVDGAEVPPEQMVRGYAVPGGDVVLLSDHELASLPMPGRTIAIRGFAPLADVDPIWFAKSYYLEPEPAGTKPYVLFSEALQESGRLALVTVALRRRETLGALRVRDQVIVLETMRWPDEVRASDFPFRHADVDIRPGELRRAVNLVEELAGDFDPGRATPTVTARPSRRWSRRRSTARRSSSRRRPSRWRASRGCWRPSRRRRPKPRTRATRPWRRRKLPRRGRRRRVQRRSERLVVAARRRLEYYYPRVIEGSPTAGRVPGRGRLRPASGYRTAGRGENRTAPGEVSRPGTRVPGRADGGAARSGIRIAPRGGGANAEAAVEGSRGLRGGFRRPPPAASAPKPGSAAAVRSATASPRSRRPASARVGRCTRAAPPSRPA